MKILVFGAGVIGTTFAWQLSEAGYDVSLLVRKQRLVRYSHSGITIACTDMRDKKKEYEQTVFRPQTIDRLDPRRPFDLIIVAIKNFQLKDAVPYISKYSGDAHVLFLGNMWNETGYIKKHFPKGRYLLGYPGMTGGGRTENSVNTYLFGRGNTMIGEPNGQSTPRLKEVMKIMEAAGLRPASTHRINSWIKSQVVWQTATFGAATKAGSVRSFAENKKLVSHSGRAIKEGFKVCLSKGWSPFGVFPFNLFYLPGFLITGMLKKSYTPEMVEVMEAHFRHGFEEFKSLYSHILADGEKASVDMTYWKSFQPHINKADKNNQ